MPDDTQIDDLRRRVAEDPASIAFAQLGEELRRAGRCDEAVAVCRSGLSRYPAYLSARVTLGRALLELNRLDEAQRAIEEVLASAPEHLTAGRTLADIGRRRGHDGPAIVAGPDPSPRSGQVSDETESFRALRMISALEAWLAAIHVARAPRSA